MEQKMKSYHNTTSLDPAQTQLFEQKALSQNETIHGFFKRNHSVKFSPSEIHNAFVYREWPITSVRRAINYLFKEGVISREEKVPGPFGREEYSYKYSG